MNKAMQIAESFINGNVSWCKEQLLGKRKLTASVALIIKEYWPDDLDRFLRLMSN